MSVRLMADVFELSEARGNDRLVLLAIADEANDDGKGGYPGFDLLAQKCRLPKTTVRRAVDRLEELGELRVFRPERRGRGHYTTYEIVLREERAEVAPLIGPEKAGKGHNGPERAATPPPTSGDAQYAVPKTQERPIGLSLSSAFDRFWDVYPRREGKGAAKRAWPRAVRAAGNDPERIIAGAERYRDDPNREEPFTAHASTWLNGERWDDPPLPPRAGAMVPRGPSGVPPSWGTIAKVAAEMSG